MSFGYIGSMRTKPGNRDEVVAILTSGQDGLQAAGSTRSGSTPRRARR